jgi:glycosyltransferase involved in cell wall biosynthesis
MESLELEGKDLSNFALFPRATGDELLSHFGWCNVVFSPGNMGLLVSTAARFGRAIICDKGSHHGPEVELAKQAGQFFVDASDADVVDQLFSRLLMTPDLIVEKGDQLCLTAKQYYSVEEMVRRHVAIVNRLTGCV